MTLPDARYKADCASCCALCCVAPAFDADQGFGYDKPAHIPCTNLLDNFSCAVHGSLLSCGFTGCMIYDCHGAGQWVTQVLFKGANWRDSADTAQAMFTAFSRQKILHELMLLLATALQYATDQMHRQLLEVKLQTLEHMSLLAPDVKDVPDLAEVKHSTILLLKSLQESISFTELKSRKSV